jgi:glycosyltransferase involved in cell wall biosynthesis
MPAYNGEKYIRQAIDSVLAQTYQDWELVVVDDGSTDGTANILDSYADPRIRSMSQQNRGQAAALNSGLRLAQGEFITNLDVDDWLTVDSLHDRVQYLVQHPDRGVVYGDGFYCDVTGRPLMRFSDNRIGDVEGDVYGMLISTPFFSAGSSVMQRRQLLDQYQLQYDESIVWCQDYDFYIRLAAVATFGVIDTPTVWYRVHGDNMTTMMAGSRRLKSLLATRLKALQSPRFATLPEEDKSRFFSTVLSQDINDGELDKLKVIHSAHFQSLSKRTQARILQQAAQDHLLERRQLAFARKLLRLAWVRNPLDPRIEATFLLGHLSPSLARSAILRWRRMRGLSAGPMASPFEAAKLA